MIYNIVFSLFLLLFSITDIRNRTIPNKLLIPFAITTIASLIFKNASIGAALMGMFIIAIPMLIFYPSGKIGGGDIKLAAISGLYLGYEKIISAFLISCILAIAFYYLSRKRTKDLPLAPFLFAGIILGELFMSAPCR